MKKAMVLLMVIISILFVSCATVRYPGDNHDLVSKLEPKEYDILGDVVLEGTTRSFLGFFTWGGATYYELLQKAQKRYDADDVINVSVDKKVTLFLGIYVSQKYIMRGVAIKYR